MERFWVRVARGACVPLVLLLLAVACRGYVAELPKCSSTVSRQPTGDLAADLPGAWTGTTDEADWHHPIAYMAGPPDAQGRRVWMFREDGTGHVWWVLNSESDSFENDEEFVWEVVDGGVVVNDFPPAIVDVRSETSALIEPIDGSVDALRGVGISRCDLEVPDGVRGFHE